LIFVLDLGVSAGDRPRENAHHPCYLHLYYLPYFYCY
jgi:hypothetical protein